MNRQNLSENERLLVFGGIAKLITETDTLDDNIGKMPAQDAEIAAGRLADVRQRLSDLQNWVGMGGTQR